MQSEPAIENRAVVRDRRRKRGNGPVEGPVFVDNSGRRSKVLRRIGLLVGVLCLGYAVVLGLAFMGIGTSIAPSSLLPFAGGQGPAGDGAGPEGRLGRPSGAPPSGAPSATPSGAPSAPSAPPSGVPTPTAPASAAPAAASD
ncbi:hypothetical protein ELQ87_16465 [Streptomyces griseoviridis]|uniref:Translation initiation factor IF-2 n=1 Tax=Streptomyces griseoviridis TaxID=45398 RepID=A0A3Q9KWG4_STRGD|nr:hypothetical protein [Streptomyces griseoviridis]AZS85717.1 hypothetical protein ELQ87_16465 [Streptomyces griseoviridis]QCN87434.1 hypothetical protein DDJ31_22820 [Streptomyces griseoviridis]